MILSSKLIKMYFGYTIRLFAPPIKSGQLMGTALIVLVDRTDLIVVLKSRQSETA